MVGSSLFKKKQPKWSLVFIRCHSLHHSLSFLVTRCHSLSFAVTCCHSLSFVIPLVVTICTTRCHSLSFFVIRCHSLLPVVTQCTTRLSFHKRSRKTDVLKISIEITLNFNLAFLLF